MRKDFCEEVLRQCGKLAVIPFFFEPTSMESYFVYFMDHHGNCFAVPFGAENSVKLKKCCSVKGVPTPVIMNA